MPDRFRYRDKKAVMHLFLCAFPINPIMTERDDLETRLQSFANEHGYVFSEQAPGVIDGLIKRRSKYGVYYCPCRVVRASSTDEDMAYNASIECPCAFVHDDIADRGRCHCNLFARSTMP